MSFPRGSSILILVLSLVVNPTNSHYLNCTGQFFDYITAAKNITNCKKLTTLRAEFGWELDRSNHSRFRMLLGIHKHSDLAWVAWGVNPVEPQMIGTRAIIGIRQLNGTLTVANYNVTAETKMHCKLLPSPVEVEFQNSTFEYADATDYYMLAATVGLPSGYNASALNMVWQIGHLADGDRPRMHSSTLNDFDSVETINLDTASSHHVGRRRHYLRVMHGIFNIVGWGSVLPAGVAVARYLHYPLKGVTTRENAIDIHKGFQISGFVIGTIGWGTGLWLGHASRHYTFRTHRLFGIFIFSIAALQMLAFKFKPAKDGPLRRYWNIYHHVVGYSLLVVIGINIFKGIAILKPHNAAWKWSYVAILAVFGFVFLCLETLTWIKFQPGLPRMGGPSSRSEDAPTSPNNKGNQGGNTNQSNQSQQPGAPGANASTSNQASTSSKVANDG